MTPRSLTLLILFCVPAGYATRPSAPPPAPPAPAYDIVIRRGRVMDPERQVDSVLNVGISGGTIVAVTGDSITGKRTIDASGLVVAPGFIDILSYDPVEPGVWTKLADGVTTNLAMHGGTTDPDRWYGAMARQRPPLNYGVSFFYNQARAQLIGNRYAAAPAALRKQLVATAERALDRGALGVSFSLEYFPGVSPEEIIPVMALAAAHGVPAFFHARYSDMEEPGTNLDGLREIIAYGRETGAAVHIDHLNSTGGTFSMDRSIALLDSARASGLDITACVYPYTFWATYLNSARFDKGWQQRFRISYGDLQLGGSSERLTQESFLEYRKLGKLAVAYAIPGEDNEIALRAPYVMIGSDAILEPGYNNHPRASGAFSRTIAVHVRELKTLTLMDAIARMTLLPARRLELATNAMRRKGRLQVGADADIVVFDAARIRDRATVEHPETPSEGVGFVLVGGKVVLDEAGLHKDVRNGSPIRGSVTRQ
ncbi:MAG: amidohydrolase family protein [Gemmatimonadaceae bacterium]|nr:amidohydrolase family protein [Gemmatimonadaceae bacterium]